MINQVTECGLINRDMLMSDCCGRKILSYLEAYGTGYDFCRFFGNESGSVMLLINSALLICGDGFDREELMYFAQMHQPFRIEGNQKAVNMLSGMEGYRRLHRNVFKLSGGSDDTDETDIDKNPRLDRVYEILSEGFPNLLDYPVWLADTSHRIRHNISRVFTYRESTTASIVYDIGGYVLVGQVATKISARGSGYARKLLKWLACYLEKQNKTSFLYALDTRESFYHEIGFELFSSEYVLEKTDCKNESAEKGKLNTND